MFLINLRPAFVLICLLVFIVPTAFYVFKFTQIEPKKLFTVSFDPQICYGCRDCPCKFDINNEEYFTLGRYDKTLCKVGYEVINNALNTNKSYIEVKMSPEEFNEFYSCITWYSNFPSIATKNY